MRLGRLAGEVGHARARRAASSRPVRSSASGRPARPSPPRRPDASWFSCASNSRLAASTSAAIAPGGEQVVDRLALAAEHHALMLGRQEAVGPVDRAAGGQAAAYRAARRTPAGRRSRCPGRTRATRRASGNPLSRKPRVLVKRGGRVVRRFGDHRADDGQFVGHARRCAGTVRRPTGRSCPRCWNSQSFLPQQADLAEEDVRLLVAAERLAVQLGEFRLVVERIELAQAAAEADVNHPLGLGRMMRRRIVGFAGNARRADDAVLQQAALANAAADR